MHYKDIKIGEYYKHIGNPGTGNLVFDLVSGNIWRLEKVEKVMAENKWILSRENILVSARSRTLRFVVQPSDLSELNYDAAK